MLSNKKRRDNRGFSLVEVVVSAAILAVIGGVIFSSFSMAVRMNARAKQTYRAANYAQKAMEYLMTDEGVETAVKTECETPSGGTGSLSWESVRTAAENYWPTASSSTWLNWEGYWTDKSYDLGIDAGSSDRVTVEPVTATYDNATQTITCNFQVTASADGVEVTLSGTRIIELTQTTPGP